MSFLFNYSFLHSLSREKNNKTLHLHHPIAIAAPTVGGRKTQAAHLAGESLERKTAHGRGTTVAKTVVQFRHRVPLSRRIGRGQAEEARETLRQGRENTEGRVRALQSLGRRPIQIAGLTRQHLAAQLRKELRVVDGRAIDRRIHLHTDETARTRGVGQHLVHIARGDE